jgi:SAM-dependent methyltransferase
MKTGFLFGCIQELFYRGYAVASGNEPYPLRSLLRQEIEKLAPGAILEVGCGSGDYAFLGYNYTGVDPNPNYIAYCRRNRAGRFEQMSGEKLDFPDKTFDAVLCLSVGHHLSDDSLQRGIREIKRVMSDDGTFFFADAVRPIVRPRPLAALLEWLDEGRFFRHEEDYLALLGNEFEIGQKLKFTEAFYQMLVLWCRKKRDSATR